MDETSNDYSLTISHSSTLRNIWPEIWEEERRFSPLIVGAEAQRLY